MRSPRATHRNFYVRSRRAGERVMASVSRFLTNKLRLKVNEAKSALGAMRGPGEDYSAIILRLTADRPSRA